MKLPNLQEAKIRNSREVQYIDAQIVRDLSLFKG